jgi:hypothetical protein
MAVQAEGGKAAVRNIRDRLPIGAEYPVIDVDYPLHERIALPSASQ